MRYTYYTAKDADTLTRLEAAHIDPPSAGADDWFADDSDFDAPEPWEIYLGDEVDELPMLA